MAVIILGGGLAGLSLAYSYGGESVILEKETRAGGLCRSFVLNGVPYDIGPHILFSKDKAALERVTSKMETRTLRRSNRIYHKGRWIKYPFENDLGSLDEEDRAYALEEFIHNPYEGYEAGNMLQFFLKTFGEGMTRLYLQPYNEKIWKFDPAYMDTQMVERIPKPPKEDIIKSAEGIPTEGYTHQLHFQYPVQGGIQQLPDAFAAGIRDKARLVNPVEIRKIRREGEAWQVETDQGTFKGRTLVNCMPLPELFKVLDAPEEIQQAVDSLLYNSIHIMVVQAKEDRIGDHFAINIADSEVLFHRISRLNFLGDGYCLKDGGTTLLIEVTYRPESYLAGLRREEIERRVLGDLERLGFVRRQDVRAVDFRSFRYAYVIYDLNHRRNADCVLDYLSTVGIRCAGRFAEFEYLNMDKVVGNSRRLAAELEGEPSA